MTDSSPSTGPRRRPTSRRVVDDWVDEHVPAAWRDAAARRPRRDPGGAQPGRLRGLVPDVRGQRARGRDLAGGLRRARPRRPAQARVAEAVLAPYNLGRLNPLGLNSAAPALFAYGTEEQRLRFLPPLVRNEEKWCQLLSEPGAGSDLASLATRAVLDGEEWVLNGQKVWTTWAHRLRLRDLPRPHRSRRCRSAAGLTYFLVDLHAPGVDGAAAAPHRRRGRLQRGVPRRRARARRAPGRRDRATAGGSRARRSPASGRWCRARARAASTASAARASTACIARAVELGRTGDPARPPAARCSSTARSGSADWTNQRVRAAVRAGGTPGPGRRRSARCTRAASTSGSRCSPPTCSAPDALAWDGRRRVDLDAWADGDAVRDAGRCCAAGPTRSRAAPPR